MGDLLRILLYDGGSAFHFRERFADALHG